MCYSAGNNDTRSNSVGLCHFEDSGYHRSIGENVDHTVVRFEPRCQRCARCCGISHPAVCGVCLHKSDVRSLHEREWSSFEHAGEIDLRKTHTISNEIDNVFHLRKNERDQQGNQYQRKKPFHPRSPPASSVRGLFSSCFKKREKIKAGASPAFHNSSCSPNMRGGSSFSAFCLRTVPM